MDNVEWICLVELMYNAVARAGLVHFHVQELHDAVDDQGRPFGTVVHVSAC